MLQHCTHLRRIPQQGAGGEGGLDQAAQIWAIRGDEGVKELGVLQVDCLQYFQHLRLGML